MTASNPINHDSVDTPDDGGMPIVQDGDSPDDESMPVTPDHGGMPTPDDSHITGEGADTDWAGPGSDGT